MLTQVQAGPYLVRGISLGGIYTSLHVRELDLILDTGLAPRSFSGARALFLSHGHADHSGALTTLIGARMLMTQNRKLRIFLPAQIEDSIRAILEAVSVLQKREVNYELVPMLPGDEVPMHSGLRVRAFRTYHPVPSLGYLFLRRVNKLRPEFHGLPGPEIQARRNAGEEMFDQMERAELAYATDTLPRVLDEEPDLYDVRVLIIECTFLDERKSAELAHTSCHIHLDDLLERAEHFRNESILLMHFSQLYRPPEVGAILAQRCPPDFMRRISAFVPQRSMWPG